MKVAQRDLLEAVEKLYREKKGTDITLVCQKSRKAAHSAVLIARSPFFEAKVERWCNENSEAVIEGCDPEALNIVLNSTSPAWTAPNLAESWKSRKYS